MKLKFLISVLSVLFHCLSYCQPAGNDSSTLYILPPTQRQLSIKQADGSDLQILSGTVKLRQGTAFFYCDSCVVNTKTKVFEAFGNVHINDSDTAHIYSNYLRYLIQPRFAYFTGNVRLTDGKGTLTTKELDYDLAGKIGTYRKGGRLVNKKTVITSDEGVYYADMKDVYFKKNVEVKDPAHYIKSDSIIYNTGTELARFISQTYFRDSSGRTIQTREGFYDMRGGRSEFTQRTRIQDGALVIEGNQIVNDEASGTVQIRENGVLIDTAQGFIILANDIFANKKLGAYLATRNPLMIIKQEKDSIYIKADTLFSARLSDRFKASDSTKGVADTATGGTTDTLIKAVVGVKPLLANDSTNRYFEAFRNVKIFSDSMQAVSDSLFYSFRDSTFELFQEPIVWSRKSQVTGDTIYLFTKNKKADLIKVFQNSFLINMKEEGVYNQVKSTRMNAFFTNGSMDSVLAKGAAESIYFIQDKDSAYTGINQTASVDMHVYFAKEDLKKIVFVRDVKGTMWPMSSKRPGEMRLKNFQWLERLRPKTKYDLLE
jgi:lipopolysaccharide export system protein LptA